jgi:hypothetical protein
MACDFFAAFAFAEFELKTNGYIRRGRDDAQADWDAFAAAIARRFRHRKSRTFEKAWQVLTASPPRKQVSRGGRLAWKVTPRPAGISDAAWGLILVRRVRNNLFHGAKFIVGGAEQFARDRELVQAAHTVLDEAMHMKDLRQR